MHKFSPQEFLFFWNVFTMFLISFISFRNSLVLLEVNNEYKMSGVYTIFPRIYKWVGKRIWWGFFHPPLYLMMQNAEQVYIFELWHQS